MKMLTCIKQSPVQLVIACLLSLSATPAIAANGNDTWLGNTDANWAVAANWSPAVNAPPIGGDWLFFGAAGSSGATLTNNLTAGTSFAGITFNAGASSYTILSNSITLTGGITNNSAAVQNINFPISGGTVFATTNGGNLTINGVMSGSTGYTIIGTNGGTVTLNGTNTHTGAVTINNATVVLGTPNALTVGTATANASGWVLQQNVILDVKGNNQTAYGWIDGIDANNTTPTGTWITNSSATLATLTITNFGNNFKYREGNFGGNLKLVLTANNLGNTQNGRPGSAFQMQVPGNTYSGGTVIQGLWGNPFTVTNLNSGTYGFATTGNTNTAILRNYNAGLGYSVLGSGPLTLDNGELWVTSIFTYTNPIVVTSRGGILNAEQNQFYAAGATVTGTGLLALEANNKQYFFTNDWSGFTGTLAVDANDTIVNFCSNSPAGDLVFWGAYNATYGTLQWNGDATQPATLAFTRANSGSAAGIAGAAILTGRLSNGMTNALTYKFGDNTATTNNFGAIIQNGSGAVGVTKIGSDTQILSAVNTYTNPTYVGGGTLVLSAVNNGGGGCVVSNGATLSFGGTGSLTNTTATVNVLAGGTLVSGGATIGGLVTMGAGSGAINLRDSIINTNTLAGGLTLDNGNVLSFDLGSASDVIAITGGAYTKNAGTVTVNVAGTGFGANTYPLITGASISSTNGFVLGTVPSNPSFAYALVAASGNLALQVTVAVVSPATAYWKGGVDNNWTTPDSGAIFNWSTNSAGTVTTGAKPGVTTAVTFSGSGAANQTTVLGGNFEINSLALTTSANVGIGGANALQLDSGGLTINSGAGNLTVSNSSLVLGGVQLWTNSSANTVTVSAPISGLSSVTLGGGNTVWSGANSHGGTTLNAGKLTLNGSGTLGSSSAAVTANSATIDLGGSSQSVGAVSLVNGSVITNGTITGTSYYLESGTISAVVGGGVINAVKSTPGTVVLSANNTFAGSMVVNNGTLQIGAGGSTGSLNEGSLAVSNGAALVFNSAGAQTNGGAISGSGPISIVGGGSVTLNNLANSFTGNMLVDGSTLIAATANNTYNEVNGSLGNPSVARTITLTNGATLSLQGGNVLGGWSSTRCGVGISVNPGCQLALNVINPPNTGDSNPLGEVDLNGGQFWAGSGWGIYNQSAILISNIVVGGTSPSTIAPLPGSDATKNGIHVGQSGLNVSADVANNPVKFIVNSTGSGSVDLTVSARLLDPPYSGSLGSGGFNTNANGGIYKDGTGTMLLTAVNSLSGPNLVAAGKLIVSSIQGATGMTNYFDVFDGAVLGILVNGTNQWSPSLAYLGTGGGGITLEFTGLNNTNVAPFNPASVSVPGPVTVNVYGALAVGQYRLIANAAGSIGSFSLGTLPPGVEASLVADTDGTTIDLSVTAGSETFVWSGQTDTNWDKTTVNNWKTNGIAIIYQDLVPVLFADGAAKTNVNLAATVTPASMMVSNNTAHYTFSSATSNKITGVAGLTKIGNGVLTLTNLNNDFSGGSTINEGTVEISENFNLGSGSVQLSGGTLSILQSFTNSHALTIGPSAGSGAGALDVAAGQTLTVANIIADTVGGSGTLKKTGSGVLTVAAYNTYSGGTVVSNGTLSLNQGGGGTGAVRGALTIYPGATVLTTIGDALGYTANVSATPINIFGGTLTNSSGANQGYISTFNLLGGTMSSSGGAYNFNGTNSAINSLATNVTSTISGPILLRADGLTITTALGTVPGGVDLQITGKITGGTNGIVKAGAGTLQTTGTNTYTGATTVGNGTLLVSGSVASAVVVNGGTLGGTGTISNSVVVNSGGTLSPGSSIGTVTIISNLTLNAGSTSHFEVNGSTPVNDAVVAGGTVVYGGTLQIVPTGSFTAGQQFQLFIGAGATNASNFASLLGSPGAGLAFDFTNGVLSVVSTIPAGPTLTSVTPNPVTGSTYAVTLNLTGSGFTGATAVLLTNLTAASGASYVPTVNSDTSISVSFASGTAASSWNATVVNVTPSAQVGFTVTTPAAVSINKNAVTSAGAGKLVLSGTGGTAGHSYAVVSTTNLAPPVIWSPVVTNAFDGSGNFSYTNVVSTGTPKLFLRIQQ